MAKSTKKGSTIEVTQSHLVECGYSREHVKKVLTLLNPSSRRGRVLYYDIATAIRALNNTGELPSSERKELAMAKLAEEKYSRMCGESIDRKAVKLAGANMIKIIVQSVKQSGIDRIACQKVLKVMRESAERMSEDIDACGFNKDD